MAERRALLLCPESPYPPHGGGALRSASIAEYLRTRYILDLVVFAQEGDPDPAGATAIIRVPVHSRSGAARVGRNLVRFARGTAPLMDRFSGFAEELEQAISGRHYDVAILEHFWMAPYIFPVAAQASRTILDLHNIESVWLERAGNAASPMAQIAFRRWAKQCRRLERELLPRFARVLVTSENDGATARRLAPETRVIVYPNAIPLVPQPHLERLNAIAFSGNLEYEPNRSAVRHFARNIWPLVAQKFVDLEWHLIGRGQEAIRSIIAASPRVRVVGGVQNAVVELARYRAAVVPILSGSGTRLKIIEAWAAGTPVVSTTLGAEGLPVHDRSELLLADQPSDFAARLTELLTQPSIAQKLAQNGRRIYEERFSWSVAWNTLSANGI